MNEPSEEVKAMARMKLQFFRDLPHQQRMNAFRAGGIPEDALSEAGTLYLQTVLFDHLMKNGRQRVIANALEYGTHYGKAEQ